MLEEIYLTFLNWGNIIQLQLPLLIYASIVLIIGFIISIISYKVVGSILESKTLKDFIDKFIGPGTGYSKLTTILKKGAAWSIFLVFVRWAVSIIGLEEVEVFLSSLLEYLPNLFIAIIIGFFGIRFSLVVYSVVYQTAKFNDPNIAKVLANLGRVIMLVFTFTIVLKNVKIVSDETFQILLIGFVFMVSLAGGLSFGLGGKRLAQDILEQFRKKPKNLKKEDKSN